MKAYIIQIEMLDLSPIVWRKVIMPADATFKRLHDVIQRSTNFRDSHLYQFHLKKEENMIVTNDEEAYEEHKFYLKNKRKYEKEVEETPDRFKEIAKRRLQLLQTTIRKPQTIKIDKYLEKHKIFHYTYDYGDDWRFSIELLETVDDYYFGYPTLLDGNGTAPPEDVGGVFGYKQFKAAYNDPNHPEHESMRNWVGEYGYREYDPEHINSMLKFVHYKKTEWDKINHVNYEVIEDKYVK